mgnify:CR=1 FL=1
MNYLIDPTNLVLRAKGYIAGFTEMVKNEEIPQWDLLETATEIATEWTEDWDEGHGFGGSDGTYMLKEFIDNVIWSFTKGGKYMTDFTPYLSVVPYSEAKHHERVQQMESGI